MKKNLKRALFLLLAVISVAGLVVTYLYLNPTIDNPDFHLEYEIANGKKKYSEDRNDNYSDKEYLFNHLTYYNEEDEKKLIIHSLDKASDGKERIIFVIEDRKGNYPIGIIDYLENNKYRLFMVEYKKDSIFVWRKPLLQESDTALFFKGKRIKGKIPNTISENR
ncbi:MAG: hypothetical protein HXL37_00915 [Riemerella sp.]|nr:hypothetical protein [Riemerella sp.]